MPFKLYFVIIEKRLFNHISQNPYQDIQLPKSYKGKPDSNKKK